jgi:hypothetical protein
MGEDGEMKSDLTVHVHFDVVPTWLELARRHLADAKLRQVERIAAWAATDEQAKAAALEREFEASMQATMAAVIAMDAFYAAIRKKADVPDELVEIWRKNKTPRDAQIGETLKVASGLKGSGFDALRQTSVSSTICATAPCTRRTSLARRSSIPSSVSVSSGVSRSSDMKTPKPLCGSLAR